MLPKPLVPFGLLVITTACAPLVPFSYVEDDPNSLLTQSIETDEATVWIRYLRSQNGLMEYGLEIANHSPYEMQFAPQQITFYASSKPFIPFQTGDDVHALSGPNSKLTMTRQFASDPSSVERLYAERAKSQKVGAGVFAILAIGLILYDAAEDSRGAQTETFTSNDAWKSFGRDVLVNSAVIASEVAQSSARQTAEKSYHLRYELFPECAINSGTRVGGKIFLPIESHYIFVRVIVPLEHADYVFDFKRRGAKH